LPFGRARVFHKDNLACMADTGVIWVPTAVTMQVLLVYRQTGKNPDAACRRDHQLERSPWHGAWG
jgi:hypothetical protein